MRWTVWLVTVLLLARVESKGRKNRLKKPGRAVLERLASTVVSEASVSNEDVEGILVPAPVDAAPYGLIEANATCGETGPEDYCREMPGKRGVLCEVCEGPDGPAVRRHDASKILEEKRNSWWQSPTLAAGDQYQHVTLTITLPNKMELLHIIIKSGPSPRPLAWSLEVSPFLESDEWRLLRAFGDKESCRRYWSLRPERRRRRVTRSKGKTDKPVCSTQFASPRPLENGEMHVGLGEGVSGRRVRISFRASHAGPSERRFYTVRSVTVAARCLCNGRAPSCTISKQETKCDCIAGYCGLHCERQCGERGACSQDDTGTILCVNCTENRAGPLCDHCLPGYYSTTSDSACLPCSCHPEGSDGTCEWNNNQKVAVCHCQEGYTGVLCDSCVDPNTNFPDCYIVTTTLTPRCKCDPRGVLEGSDVCSDVCHCKSKVVGERCDACAPGHFGLSAALTDGCRRCYCSSVTDMCSGHPDKMDDMSLPLGNRWRVRELTGERVTEPTLDEAGRLYLSTYEVEDWSNFYWMTDTLSGDQLSLYGSEFRYNFFWGVVRGDAGGEPTKEPDVILLGKDGSRLAFGNNIHETPGQTEITAPLVEGSWYQVLEDEEQGETASRQKLLDVLSDLRAIMFRARFHMDQDEVRLDAVDILAPEDNLREMCSCPIGYEGPSCSRCAWTHVRIDRAPDAVPKFECISCACNGHAGCDPDTGVCGECHHNTTGLHCERCAAGHYGNPALGACLPCACPLLDQENNFSPNCALAAATGDEFVCTQCPEGYIGDHCESCDYGYWGSPTTRGSSCRPCACDGAPCDPVSGECIQCPPHAEGARCDQCEEGYWLTSGVGSACEACECGPGALTAACDASTGSCACREGWSGQTCDICAPGHGDLEAGCPLCRCGLAAQSSLCDARTGACLCAQGAAPPTCHSCLPEHYAIEHAGCTSCNCSSLGAENNVCDIRTGQCRCREHVTGRACDVCEEGYWGLQSGGCRRCLCGAGAAACHPDTGSCACAPGAAGQHCDRCLPGYYGFGPTGCLPCPACGPGQVCSPVTGRCVCPSRTRGPACETCAVGSWGRNQDGCRACSCGAGALSDDCDPISGQCQCRAGWTGRACDTCATGHYGVRCKPCSCVAAGTADCDPDTGVCPCDNDGQCHCKENVVGIKCSECRDGTFGLTADSPAGCTACFCFGRSAHCSQAGLTRAALRAPSKSFTLEVAAPHQHLMERDSAVTAIHVNVQNVTIPLPWPPTPVYFELGDRFLGDLVTSYGGMLRFKIKEDGGEPLDEEVVRRYPLVKIYSGSELLLEYFQRVPPKNDTYGVRLHESLWRVRWRSGGGGHASRAALMVALTNVTRLLLRTNIRGPTITSPVQLEITNVSLDTAVPGSSKSPPALGVEMCACPSPYASSSCQDPAIGFWMPPPNFRLNHVEGTIVINMEGDALPCECNGRANTCDPDTGYCLNCTGGTGGAQCQNCAEGYIGAPDAPGGCQPCPCPDRGRNFAKSCHYNDGTLECLCKLGYTGTSCEICADGWYRTENHCVPCSCDLRGAISTYCDAHGRCSCREYAVGPRCDMCKTSRTYLQESYCQPCDNCTQTLMDTVEDLTKELHLKANVSELSRVPKPYPALRQFSNNATSLRNAVHNFKRTMASSSGLNNNAIEDLENGMQSILDEAEFLKNEAIRHKEKAIRHKEKAQSLSLESMSSLEAVINERSTQAQQVEALEKFSHADRHLTAHRALKEARHLLKNIKDVRLIDYIGGANDVFDSANLQSTAVKEYTYRVEDTMRRVHNIQLALEQLHAKADDINNFTDIVWDAGDLIAAQAKHTKPRLAVIRDKNLRTGLILEDVVSLAANNLTEEIREAIGQAQILAEKVPAFTSELETLTLATEEKEGILYNLTPVYRQKYLEAAEKHVQELGEKAKNYKNLFSGSATAAASSMAAATAWAAVSATLSAASKEAKEAVETARRAHELARGSQPMLQRSHLANTVSRDQKRRAEELLKEAEELRTELEKARRGAERVSVTLRGAGGRERELGARPRADITQALSAADAVSERVFATSRALYDEAAELRRRTQYQLRRRLTELQQHGDTALGAAQELVSQIRGNSLRAKEVADALHDAASARAREHLAADGSLGPSTAQLRDNIAKARHAADTISVSLTSAAGSVGCARAYRVFTSSPSVTRISLALSFDVIVRDGPLLWVGAAGSEEIIDGSSYIKLMVEDRKLKLFWSLGDGEAVLEHPAVLEPAHDDAAHTSYRIEIERVWSTVRLSVERAGSATPVVATNSTNGTLSSFLPPVALWLGATGARTESKQTGLPGCVHALYYDDSRIGLWNFLKQPSQARCTGCTQRWVGSSSRAGEPSLVWFNGRGYAELRRSELRPYNKRHFTVSFTFRTRDEDALLFMTVDTTNNRSISVFLRACRVVFRVEYAASTLEIVAGGRHCLGRPTHVQAIRLFHKDKLEKGSLRVNGEETLGSPEPPVQDAASLPDVGAAKYWLGGTPPGASRSYHHLLGCLGGLLVDREGYDLLDTPRRHGVEPSCVTRTLRSMIVEGSGWVEMPSPALRRRSAVGISFTSRAPSGLVFLRAPTTLLPNDYYNEDDVDEEVDQDYLLLALRDGSLELSASTNKGSVKIQSNNTRYDDGSPHTVKIVRAHKQLELWVDEELVAGDALGGGTLSGRTRGIFVGGHPPSANISSVPTLRDIPAFTGTIADAIVDDALLGFENAIRWSGVQLGRADAAADRALPPTQLTEPPDNNSRCSKTSSYTLEPGAVKFGDAPNSYAVIKIPSKALKQLSLSLQFRTFRRDGLLLLIPGSKTKPKHYLALTVKEGRLQLIVRGRKRRAVSLAVEASTGSWRAVTVRVGGARLVLSSGGTAATARAPRRLALAPRLYVGGLPERNALPNIPDSIYRVGGLVGCIRRAAVSGRAEDLVRSASTHRRVGQCFPNVEQAAHFSGDAYAVWSSSWPEDQDGPLEVSLQMRTAEPNGLLMATAQFLLEIRDGEVELSRVSSSGAIVGAVKSSSSVCDDRWHSVRAKVWAGGLQLTVDTSPEVRSDAGPLHAHPNRPAPLYIAGLPEDEEVYGSKHNFRGCLRDVGVAGTHQDWSQMETLHNVLLDSCPVNST